MLTDDSYHRWSTCSPLTPPPPELWPYEQGLRKPLLSPNSWPKIKPGYFWKAGVRGPGPFVD